jgi:hypothetical protein
VAKKTEWRKVMADNDSAVDTDQPGPLQIDVTPAAAQTTDTPTSDEHMIPKSRFDEINNKYKELITERENADKERAESERQQLEEQKKFQELYEQEKAAREQAIAEMKALQLRSLRRDVAIDVGLPNALTDRLIGETREEIEADAKQLMKTLPKPKAPTLDGGAGSGGRNTAGKKSLSDAERKELAAIYGIDPQYLPENL